MISAPHPTPTPTPTPATPTGGTGASDTLSGLIHFVLEHPVPFLLIAAWFGALYLYNYKLRPAQQKKGRPIQPLGRNIRRTLKFAFREDTGPVFTKPAPLAAKTGAYTWQRHYLTLIVAAVSAHFVAPTATYVLILVLAGTIAQRARTVFTTRHGILMQMFAIAAAECKYPREAAYNPWGWIQVQEWHDHTRPGLTAVSFPPGIYQAEDYKTREKFERNFNGTVSEEHMWTYKWESTSNRVILKPTPHLPEMAPYPGPGSKWNEIILGTAGDDEQAIWDVTLAPHALICGPTGSGKSVMQRMILFHCLAHADRWRIIGIDPKKVEMSWLEDYPNVLKIALDLEEGIEVTTNVRDEMTRRYDEMREAGVNHFLNLPDPPPALMLMIDETFNFLSPENIKSEEGKERDGLHAQGQSLLGEIARLGRAAGIYIAAATQRPDSTVIKGEFKNNLDCRVACGRMDTTPSLMVLDSEAATRLPKIKGRAMVRLGGDLTVFQGYFAEQDWYDKFVAAGQAAADDVADGDGAVGDDVHVPAPVEGARKRLGGLNPLSRVNAFVERKQAEQAGLEAHSGPVVGDGATEDADYPDAADPGPVEEPLLEVPDVELVDGADLFSSESCEDEEPAAPAPVLEPLQTPAHTVPEPVPALDDVTDDVELPAPARGIPMVSFTPPVKVGTVVVPEPAPEPEPVIAVVLPTAASEPSVPEVPEVPARRPLPGTHKLPGTPARLSPTSTGAPLAPVAVLTVEEPDPLTPPATTPTTLKVSPTWGPTLDGNDWD